LIKYLDLPWRGMAAEPANARLLFRGLFAGREVLIGLLAGYQGKKP